MTIEDALNIVDLVLANKSLSNIQEAIFRQTWEGKTYSEIAEVEGYDAAYIRDVGYKLWQLLSDAFGDRVTKNNLQVVLRRYCNRSPQIYANSASIAHQPTQSSGILPLAGEAFSQEISNGASKLLQLLSRVLTEPIGDRYLQQIHDSHTDSSLKLTITVNLSMAE